MPRVYEEIGGFGGRLLQFPDSRPSAPRVSGVRPTLRPLSGLTRTSCQSEPDFLLVQNGITAVANDNRHHSGFVAFIDPPGQLEGADRFLARVDVRWIRNLWASTVAQVDRVLSVSSAMRYAEYERMP